MAVELVRIELTFFFVGTPSVTHVTYADQSRTLTCTSTGGPATTVTWRRDGVVITLNATHQETKRLVDLVNGTYQTVLTINSSVSQCGIVGTYNCTVENARGESSGTVDVPGESWIPSFDPKMSAYQTVLAIDQSVGQIVRTYNCTVGMPGKYSFLLFNVSAYHCFIYKNKFPIHK